MKPEKIRKDFPIFQNRDELVYLDNAATSQKPEQVIETVENFYIQNNSNVGRGLYDLASDATQQYREARKTVASFIGAKTSETVFVRNSTEAENFLADSLQFEGGIVISEMSHHSEQLPWRRRAEEDGRELDYLKTEKGRISLESARKKIDEETGLVAISHISNVFGARNPIKEIIDLAHEKGALVMLDAAQSVPHQPIDVKELEVDFLCFSGHKMLSPTGVGVLYGKKGLLEDIEPYQIGGGAVDKVTSEKVDYACVPERFEAGTQNIAGAVGLTAAVKYLENIGMEEVEKHTQKLASQIIEGLREIGGISVLSPEGANLVSFEAEWAHPHDIAEVLNHHGIAVRAGMHCAHPQMEELGLNGTTRASPYLYNTEEDVEKFLEAISEVKDIFEV